MRSALCGASRAAPAACAMVSATDAGVGCCPARQFNPGGGNSPVPEAAISHATPAALATAWCQLMGAADEAGISDAQSEALIERADAVLDRLAETPANTEAALAVRANFGRVSVGACTRRVSRSLHRPGVSRAWR